jgi:hypothetical protein
LLIIILILSKPYSIMAVPAIVAFGAMAGSIGASITAGVMLSIRKRKH